MLENLPLIIGIVNLFVTGGIMIATLAGTWAITGWRIKQAEQANKEIQRWQERHEREANKRDNEITMLQTQVVQGAKTFDEIKSALKGMNDKLDQLWKIANFNRRNRNDEND